MNKPELPLLEALRFKRIYTARRERLFDAWTDPQRFKKWFGQPSFQVVDARIDLRVGGAYRFEIRMPDGGSSIVSGQYRTVENPSKLEFTWNTVGKKSNVHDTLVTVEFIDRKDSTELVLTHGGFTDAQTRNAHQEGWTLCLDALEQFSGKG
ncbi:MAG: SRPBCC domain-containing protein [Phycisphaerales bacterium]|nr:MAG: SRPBCC domain-containing protein [Phycisphaerales bacterium]